MELSIFKEFYDLGITAIPVIWDTEKRIADSHPEHDPAKVTIDIEYVDNLISGKVQNFAKFVNSNAVAIKVIPPLGMFDFDLKNTSNKTLYSDWVNMVNAENPEIFRKVCVEKTRSGGYHVYIKYHKLDHKIPIARSEGKEVISVYTGSLLSYCSPTPGYEVIHNDWADIDFLTDAEFQLLVTCAAHFNEDAEHVPGQSTVALVDYPVEYESTCLQFDSKIHNDDFETLLNSIGLFRCKKQYNRKKWVAFLREGSTGAYSAKVYFKSKRCLIFSASMPKFPSWHDSAKCGDDTWSLTPSKIVFYKNNKDWQATIEEINCICDSAGIEIEQPKPITQQQLPTSIDRLKFPYDIFPDAVKNYINIQSIQHEYIAANILVASACAIGNSVQLEAIHGYLVKPILYLTVVAPPGSSKTPALKKAFAPLEKFDANLYNQHKEAMKRHASELADAKKNKSEEPEKPILNQILIKDSTIEMVIKILSHNKMGCCVYADELDGFLRRMNQYKDGDEVQKWLELWSGSPILLQRISRDENKVQEPVCSIVGGIQPGVLENMSKSENQHNGFFHRFLFCYPIPQEKQPFASMSIPYAVTKDYYAYFERLLSLRTQEQETYIFTQAAFDLYKEWFDYKNTKYNKSLSDNVKGIIAKYQDYCLRFAILIQVMNETNKTGMVSHVSMNGAIRLTEYFLGNMHKALRLLSPETPIDKLNDTWQDIYRELPVTFTTKTAVTIGEKHGQKETAIKMFLQRNIKKLFDKVRQGEYEKLL